MNLNVVIAKWDEHFQLRKKENKSEKWLTKKSKYLLWKKKFKGLSSHKFGPILDGTIEKVFWRYSNFLNFFASGLVLNIFKVG